MEMNVKTAVFLIFMTFCGFGFSEPNDGTEFLDPESQAIKELLLEIGNSTEGVNKITGESKLLDKLRAELEQPTLIDESDPGLIQNIQEDRKAPSTFFLLEGISPTQQQHMKDLSDAIYSIDNKYEHVKHYMTYTNSELKQLTLDTLESLKSLASDIVSHKSDSVRRLVDKIHQMIFPHEDRIVDQGILIPLREGLQKERGIAVCELHQSPQQLLYNLYKSITRTESKGYAMMHFSWKLLKLHNKGDFSRESQTIQEEFKNRINERTIALKKVISGASSELWRCDPKYHRPNETYVEVTRLLQGYIENEVFMNPADTCCKDCAYYSYAKTHRCYEDQFCARQPKCNGKIIDCRFIESDASVCLADTESYRRYDWIEYENGRVLGDKVYCTKQTTNVYSWHRWFYRCSYCFCLCDEEGPKSDRYFNLRRVVADVDKNMVVTGLRFVKVNRVIHLQIQQASLLPHGGINTNSVHWRPIDDYKISDWDVINGEDYFTLSWAQRAIDLDDILAPEGHVLTGIRFRSVGTHLNLEIMVTPIDFTKGTLINPKERSIWIGNDNSECSRTRLNLKNPDVPTHAYSSKLDSKSNQFLQFTHSDLDKDAAQTTVPFIDAQEAVPDPPILLAGAGIYHKGEYHEGKYRSGEYHKEYHNGGFIAPKVLTYDYMRHITTDTSK